MKLICDISCLQCILKTSALNLRVLTNPVISKSRCTLVFCLLLPFLSGKYQYFFLKEAYSFTQDGELYPQTNGPSIPSTKSKYQEFKIHHHSTGRAMLTLTGIVTIIRCQKEMKWSTFIHVQKGRKIPSNMLMNQDNRRKTITTRNHGHTLVIRARKNRELYLQNSVNG